MDRPGSPRVWAQVLAVAAVIGVPSAAIGVLVIRRQRGNPLGWLFLVSARSMSRCGSTDDSIGS